MTKSKWSSFVNEKKLCLLFILLFLLLLLFFAFSTLQNIKKKFKLKSKSVENLLEVFLGFTFNMVGVELKCNYGSLKQINNIFIKKIR